MLSLRIRLGLQQVHECNLAESRRNEPTETIEAEIPAGSRERRHRASSSWNSARFRNAELNQVDEQLYTTMRIHYYHELLT